MSGMRRTLFVVSRDFAAAMRCASGRAHATAERRRLSGMLADQDVTANPEAWITNAESDVLTELAARGEATARELREVIPELRETLRFGEGKTWGGTMGVSTRILFLLAARGAILRARPLGSWISSQYRWTPTRSWLGDDLPGLDPERARAQLAYRWLSQFGPGTFNDIKWWAGWSARDARSALEACDAVEVDLGEGTGWILPDDIGPVEESSDWVALLPSLDSTVMGWKERDWFMNGHDKQLFDRNGNAGPTVWWNGAVVGGWAQRGDGEIALRILTSVPTGISEMINAKAQRLHTWLDTTRITPRFRTPLEHGLRS